MKETIRDLVKDKMVLILGFGREGQSSFRMISSVGGFTCLDIADANAVSSDLTAMHNVITGAGYLDCLDDYDVVFKSPGIVLPKDIKEYKCHIRENPQLLHFYIIYSRHVGKMCFSVEI